MIGDYSYTYGAKLECLNLEEESKDVDVKDHSCADLIKKLWYMQYEIKSACNRKTRTSTHLHPAFSLVLY